MSFAAVGVGGALAIGGIGAAGSIAGAAIGAGAAGSAADKQAAASQYATDMQRQMYDQTRADQQPWRDAGAKALSQMSDPDFQKSFTAADFQQDPGYQFRMQQGQDAIERSAAARGGLQSGGTLKAINEYGQNFASNEYGNAYNRFNNDRTTRFNRLSSIAGAGQTATNEVSQAGQNFGAQAGQNAIGAANAQGAAGIAGANAWGGALSSISQMPKTWMDYNLMSQYLGKGGGGMGAGASGYGKMIP